MAQRQVLQFKITLQEIEPLIWRRIQISDLCTFWDLHIAIQDAMGWSDCHLHQFEVNHSIETGKQLLGIPIDEEIYDHYQVLPDWEYSVRDYLKINEQFKYTYDFGDDWEHIIKYEGLHNKQPNQKYPVCLAGENACPPEDVGGSDGYYRFLAAIQDPEHTEHDRMIEWVGKIFEPHKFDPKQLKFSNPRQRWKFAFERN